MKQIKMSDLGSSYQVKFKIDLVNNKREALIVNVLGLVVMVIMIIPFMINFYKVGKDLASGRSVAQFLWNCLFVILACFLYLVAHEAVHGLVMKAFINEKLRFGYKFVYAYAGSTEGLFRPLEYILVALAPLVFFGFCFELCRRNIPYFSESFYFLQMMNISGSMGDVYVVFRILCHVKEKLLINDTGTDMTVFEKV